jgi:hypothetical protein
MIASDKILSTMSINRADILDLPFFQKLDEKRDRGIDRF